MGPAVRDGCWLAAELPRRLASALPSASPIDRPGVLMTALAYAGAALAEIAGCFAFWAWLRQGQSIWWLVPGILCLIAFAWLLTLVEASHAGRVFAAYGGVYIAASLAWLWAVEGMRPDRWDLTGGLVCLLGAAIIILGPRAA